jgi:predicted permease
VRAVRALPGVVDASFSAVTPVSNNTWDTVIENPAGLSLSEADRRVYRNEVSPAWFATYGIPVVSGRDFTPLDQGRTPTVAIVNESFARQYFAGRNPIGQTIREVGSPPDATPPLTIVGLVKDAVYVSLREGPMPTMYVPALLASAVSVRAETTAPAALASTVRAAIAGVDSDLALTIRPLANDFALFVARERILALLAGFFGVLALFLSAIGLYGVVSYGVSARRAEIGIRMALGASPFSVVGLVVRRTILLISIGVLVGVPISLWSARSVSALLFGLQAYDPATYLSAVGVLLGVGVAAAWAPARRAVRINPAIALRVE